MQKFILLATFVVAGLCFGFIYLMSYLDYSEIVESDSRPVLIVEVTEAGAIFTDPAEAIPEMRFVIEQISDEVHQEIEVGDTVQIVAGSNYGTWIAGDVSPPSQWLLVVMGGLIFTGALFLIVPWVEQRRLRKADGDAVAIIREMLRRTRFRWAIGTGFFLACTALFGVVTVFAEAEANFEVVVMIALTGGTLILTCMTLLRFFGLLRLDKAWILQMLHENPEKVVWFYPQRVEHKVVQFAHHESVIVCFSSGQTYQIQVGESGGEKCIASLQRLAEHALVGYSSERAQRFATSPDTMLSMG